MRRLGRWAIGLAAALGLLFVFGPYERVEVRAAFDRSLLEGGVGAFLAAREAAVGDIRLGAEKRVHWYGLAEVPTDMAVVYLHGFSSSAEELRPVPDRVAAALGANLVFTRLSGHGRDGTALADVTVGDWMHDVAEALEIGQPAVRGRLRRALGYVREQLEQLATTPALRAASLQTIEAWARSLPGTPE